MAGYAADALRPAMSGALLAPWPNRIADGRYFFAGEWHDLVVNELETRTASHGLIAWQDFVPTRHAPASLVLTATIAAQPGYPWRLRVVASFELGPEGLHHTLTVHNESGSTAPVGLGAHPYLVAGSPEHDAIAEWTFTLPAEEVLLTDHRSLPARRMPVGDADGGVFDFRGGRRIGSTAVNHAFTRLHRGATGHATARLVADDGTGVELTWDGEWAQVYTADESSGGRRRYAVAVEPMTCPPNAFVSGVDLRALAPGDRTSLEWLVRAVE